MDGGTSIKIRSFGETNMIFILLSGTPARVFFGPRHPLFPTGIWTIPSYEKHSPSSACGGVWRENGQLVNTLDLCWRSVLVLGYII